MIALLWALGEARAEEPTCASPAEAVEQFYDHMQPGSVDPAAAAACFDVPPGSRFTATELAVQLQELLDARGLVLAPGEASPDPGFKDDAGRPFYTPFPDRAELKVERVGDRWLWSRYTLRAVPTLHAETFHGLAAFLQRVVPAEVAERRVGPMKAWQIGGLLLILVAAALVAALVNFVLHERVQTYARNRGLPMHEDLFQRTQKWLALLAIAYTVRYTVPELMLQAVLSSWLLLLARMGVLVAGIAIAWRWLDLLARIALDRAAKRDLKGADQIVPMVKRLGQAAFFLGGSMWFLRHLGVDVDGMLAGLGIGGLALALGAQQTLANLFASLTIFLDAPFQVGDWVKIGSVSGKIEAIGLRSTRVRTFSDIVITVPNSTITGSSIENTSARRHRLVTEQLGIEYATPPATIEAFLEGIRGVIRANPAVRKGLVDAQLSGFKDSWLEVSIVFFVEGSDAAVEVRTKTAVFLEILRLAERMGVGFAFPTSSLYVEALPEAQPRREASEAG